MRFFLKSIDCWSIIEIGWTKPANATLELVTEKNGRLSNDKALHALCQALLISAKCCTFKPINLHMLIH
jgi:hypothetical protein